MKLTAKLNALKEKVGEKKAQLFLLPDRFQEIAVDLREIADAVEEKKVEQKHIDKLKEIEDKCRDFANFKLGFLLQMRALRIIPGIRKIPIKMEQVAEKFKGVRKNLEQEKYLESDVVKLREEANDGFQALADKLDSVFKKHGKPKDL